jgi:enoyl-CoA hydratase/carnithine racemase
MAAVEFPVQGHLAVVTINRPEACNAINADMAVGFDGNTHEVRRVGGSL